MKKLILILLLIPFGLFAQFDGLDTLHANNILVTGVIKGAIQNPKAWAYQDSNAVTTTIVQEVWKTITNWTEGGENGIVTFNVDTIFVNQTGDYQVSLNNLSVSKTAGATAYFEFGISINGAEPLFRHRISRQITSADVGAMPLSVTMSLTAGDWVLVQARNNTNSDDVTVIYCEFEAVKE